MEEKEKKRKKKERKKVFVWVEGDEGVSSVWASLLHFYIYIFKFQHHVVPKAELVIILTSTHRPHLTLVAHYSCPPLSEIYTLLDTSDD